MCVFAATTDCAGRRAAQIASPCLPPLGRINPDHEVTAERNQCLLPAGYNGGICVWKRGNLQCCFSSIWSHAQFHPMMWAKPLSGLKIRVSVVRFHPWPPFKSMS